MAVICTFLVGSVFLFSGLIKSVYISPFINHIARFRVLPAKVNALAALLMVELECGLGMSLILHLYPDEVMPLAIFLILLLSFISLWAYVTGRIEECGCYGGLISISPWQSFLLNLLYVAILVIGWRARHEDASTGVWKVWIVILIILISGYFAKRSINFPLIDFSKLRVGNQWQSTWAHVPNINAGICLVFLMSANCKTCKTWAAHLSKTQIAQRELSIVCIFPDEPGADDFVDQKIGSNIPYFKLNRRLFNRLVFQAPTAVMLQNGIVIKKWITEFPNSALS